MDFRVKPGNDDKWGEPLMNWPILSTVTYLPLVGAAIIFFFIRGEGPAVRRNILNVALRGDGADVPDLAAHLVELRQLESRLPVRRGVRLDAAAS